MTTRVLDFLYITRSRAEALGFTHEGTLFGVPAWLIEQDSEVCFGCPKIVPLQLWAMLADAAFEFATNFIPEDRVLASPIHITAPIGVSV